MTLCLAILFVVHGQYLVFTLHSIVGTTRYYRSSWGKWTDWTSWLTGTTSKLKVHGDSDGVLIYLSFFLQGEKGDQGPSGPPVSHISTTQHHRHNIWPFYKLSSLPLPLSFPFLSFPSLSFPSLPSLPPSLGTQRRTWSSWTISELNVLFFLQLPQFTVYLEFSFFPLRPPSHLADHLWVTFLNSLV